MPILRKNKKLKEYNDTVVYIDDNDGIKTRVAFNSWHSIWIPQDMYERMKKDKGGSVLLEEEYLIVVEE